MRIYVYGTGKYASNFLIYSYSLLGDILGFVETQKTKNTFMGKPVYAVNEFKNIEKYDLIIVASQFTYDIKAALYNNNIDLNKVVFLANSWVTTKINNGEIFFDFSNVSDVPRESSVFFELSGVYTTMAEIANYFAEKETPAHIWNKLSNYEVGIHAPHLAVQQRSMLESCFIPILSRNDSVIDIGCASGEWSRFMSPYVGNIDGFDISEHMIETARKLAGEYGFHNLQYSCGDVSCLDIEKIYDNGLMLGVGIYLDEMSLGKLIDKVASHIKAGGCLAVRDTVTMYTDNKIYLARKGTDHIFENYRATYLPKKLYEKMFLTRGFEILEERYFCSYYHEPLELGSHGWIFRKE